VRDVDEELTDLLAIGEQAAFHGRPAAGVAPLQRAVERAHAAGHDAEATAAAWLLGVCLAAAGRYGSAMVVLEPLAESGPGDPERALFASLAAASLGSVARQLGRHTEGRRLDERALALAGDAPEARFDALLGLAADGVGLEDVTAADVALADAATLADGRPDWWRQRVRLDWVRAEIALLRNRADEAVLRAQAAIALAEESGAPRHVAKGLLFCGVAQVQTGGHDEAAATLRRAATLAESLATVPLVWPARAVLGALVVASNPSESAASLAAARVAVRQIADDLPGRYAEDWLARPDIAALFGD
jgi:tetratricopeptide (TPR) repeat protein